MIEKYLQESNIFEWSNLEKCLIILTVAFLENLLWFFWRIFVEKNPDIWLYVNLDVIKSLIYTDFLSFLFISILIFLCYKLKDSRKYSFFLSNLIFFSLTLYFIADGYLLGIFSPVTIGIYFCFCSVSLMLFKLKEIYIYIYLSIFIFVALFLLISFDLIIYAPVFNVENININIVKNKFVLYTMLYFLLPMFFCSFILGCFLILQWSKKQKYLIEICELDPLTNVLNRRAFFKKIESKLNVNYSLIILDIDYLKKINDKYGHVFGDKVLIDVAQKIKFSINYEDFFARYGGEEFIIFTEETDRKKIIKLIQKLQESLSEIKVEFKNQSILNVTASFGVVISTINNKVEDNIILADNSLYKAKNMGRNTYVIYS